MVPLSPYAPMGVGLLGALLVYRLQVARKHCQPRKRVRACALGPLARRSLGENTSFWD